MMEITIAAAGLFAGGVGGWALGYWDGFAQGYAKALHEAEKTAGEAFARVSERCCAKGTVGCEQHHSLGSFEYECCVVAGEPLEGHMRLSSAAPTTFDCA